jgi:predicted HicB family RNase H-like nuclease
MSQPTETTVRKVVFVRVDPDTHAKLAERAAEMQRSVSAHVVYLIEQDLKEAA